MGNKSEENNARNAFQKKSLGRIHVVLVENQNDNGTPDSMCENRRGVAFWLEFKADAAWPKREATQPLRLAFRKGQIPFMKAWISFGCFEGRKAFAFVLYRCEGEYYLLGVRAQDGVELVDCTKRDILRQALATGLSDIVKYLEELK